MATNANRPMCLRSGRRVLSEVTNKTGPESAQNRGHTKKQRLEHHEAASACSTVPPSTSSFALVPMPAQPFEDVKPPGAPPPPLPTATTAHAERALEPEPTWMACLPPGRKQQLIRAISRAMHSQNAELRTPDRAKIQTDLQFRFASSEIAEAVSWLSQTGPVDEMDVGDTSDVEAFGLEYDCDVADRDDPKMHVEYVDDMYTYYREAERLKAPTLYMHTQQDITARMRAILIDWLVEVALRFRLVPGTLYLCVHLIDCYCASNPVRRSKLQLVGITALLIACKHDEIYPPEIKDCVVITDYAYTAKEVLRMEYAMLQFFGYSITAPTGYHFLVRYLKVTGIAADRTAAHRAAFFSERCLQEHDMLVYKPSLVSAAAVFLALTAERDDAPAGWEDILVGFSGYSRVQMLPCARRIAEHVCAVPSRRPLEAIKNKFGTETFDNVANEDPPIL